MRMGYEMRSVFLALVFVGLLQAWADEPGLSSSQIRVQTIIDSSGTLSRPSNLLGTLEGSLPLEEEVPATGALMEDSLLYPDSVWRHYYYVLPGSYDHSRPNPMVVWLHGGVSTEELASYDETVLEDWPLIPDMLDAGYVIVLPCAQLGATWWDENGQLGVLEIVREMKGRLNVDDSRVFVGGFSDGASGSWALMMLYPSPFAGYMAFSGHLGVASLDGSRETYLPSLSNRPGLATHSDMDGLYPISRMEPTVDLALAAGADLEYSTFYGYEHDPAYLREFVDDVICFLDTTQRERFPDSVVWKAGEPSRCDWLCVDSIIPWPLVGEDFEYNTVLVSDRLMFGFYPDYEYEGEGVRISAVVDGDLPATRMGFQSGDVIVSFQGSEVSDLEELYELEEGLRAGDPFSLSILRNGDRLDIEDRFNPPEYYWLLSRSAPAVRVEAVRRGNTFELDVNRLCRLGLLLHPGMVDLDEDVVVLCNGREVYRGRVEQSGELIVGSFLRSFDRSRIWSARLELNLEESLMPLMAPDRPVRM
ncbi:PDZ domain-containing protein [Candidatus Fermentibacteria bacterium]|nr:PDZ domain-containing protein [Candidatus Fermentibacteria bacterium]